MVQDLENNAVYSTEYRNTAPKKGDMAAIFENGGRGLLRTLQEDGTMILPDASAFASYWIDPADEEGEEKFQQQGGRLVYLFTIDEISYYTFIYSGSRLVDFSFTKMEFLPFSFENKPKPKNVYFAAETAWQLYTWYMDNRFCGRCGGKMRVHPDMRCVKCEDCGYMVFPRILPAVIIAVIHNDRLLMIRYRGREEDGYAGAALIAGFCEIGETIEDTVRREVMEEAGLVAGEMRYYKSQPWGFASNLLFGVICDIEGDDTIKVQDRDEVAAAIWLTRDQISQEYNDNSITNEMIAYFKYGDDFPNHKVI